MPRPSNEKSNPSSTTQLKHLPRPIKTSYTSEQVDIPEDFLKKWASDKVVEPQIERIDFAGNNIPEYDGLYACVIDNVLTPSECATMLKLAEDSTGTKGWQPALVNVGGQYEILVNDYRNSDRIIWDSPELVNRLWQRCLESAADLKHDLAVVDSNSADQTQKERALAVLGPSAGTYQTWSFLKVNERMRFLRYGEGQFFQHRNIAHCDGSYEHPDHSEHYDRTLYTLQLYLNEDGVEGGATSFWAPRTNRRLEVAPRMGRVLIFQHRNLRHSGDEVKRGVKYTMRSDIMYRLQVCDEPQSQLP